MKNITNSIILVLIFVGNFIFSQEFKKDSLRGDFIYQLRAKPDSLNLSYIYDELFSLQIGDNYSVFNSLKSLKRDSIVSSVVRKGFSDKGTAIDFRNVSLPKTKYPYTIIQSQNKISFFETVVMSPLTYSEPVLKNWKIFGEEKKISTFLCKRAEIDYKGRHWIAWYTPDIPFQKGPYKFSGLPGLIVKISDSKGDYDFELVKSTKSSELKGRLIVLNYNKIENATETTPLKIDQAKQNLKNNPVGNLESLGVNVTEEQKNSFRNRLREQNNKRENRLELEF